MMIRTYLDERGLRFRGTTGEALRDAIDDLVDACEDIESHLDETILGSLDEAYASEVEPGLTLVDFLFPTDRRQDSLRDARLRLIRTVERLESWEEAEWAVEVDTFDVTVDDELVFAPTLAQAAAADAQHGPVATLALRTARDGGPHTVSLGDTTATLHAITTPSDRPHFVRAWILAHPPTPSDFHTFADRCFPDLEWTDEARAGLRKHSKWFFSDRFETTVQHLGVLNDHAAEVFATHTEPTDRLKRLGALGVDASPESPNTKKDRKASAERLVQWNGQSIHFWWHTKIRYDSGRIHFHYDGGSLPARPACIVVGLCVEHLK